ncbi:MAG: hypothetical protein MPK34_08775, partial [Gammaproteobacteria bacterium]|nr:hypothetical protein [Gammaproteobacteria bacterium]
FLEPASRHSAPASVGKGGGKVCVFIVSSSSGQSVDEVEHSRYTNEDGADDQLARAHKFLSFDGLHSAHFNLGGLGV